MKAGTTSLFNFLAQHPGIAPCKEKEPNFFSHHYDKRIQYYLNLWKQEDRNRNILLEATVNYTKHPSLSEPSQNLLDFTKNYNIDMKFIYIMRNPIERIVSHYTHAFAHWTDDTLEEYLKDGRVISVSRYAHQLDQYYAKFSQDNLLLLDFDDLKKQPDKLLKQVCVFLDIDSTFSFTSTSKVHNVGTGRIVIKPLRRLYNKHPNLRIFLQLFPLSLREFFKELIFHKKIEEKFELTDAQEEFVYNALKDDMKRLHDVYGVNVSQWGF
jgi:hypothetical protein